MTVFKEKIQYVYVDQIRQGDTIIMDGIRQTVNRDTIKRYHGETTVNGRNIIFFKGEKIARVLYPKGYKGELLGYVAQL